MRSCAVFLFALSLKATPVRLGNAQSINFSPGCLPSVMHPQPDSLTVEGSTAVPSMPVPSIMFAKFFWFKLYLQVAKTERVDQVSC
jgi:hypothetical protein